MTANGARSPRCCQHAESPAEDREHGDGVAKALLLERHRSVVEFRRMKMRERAVRRGPAERVGKFANAIPAHAGATDAGVDREMPGSASALGPFGDRARGRERGDEFLFANMHELAGQQRREDDDGPRRIGGANLTAFIDGRDAESEWRGVFRARAQPIRRRGRSRPPSPSAATERAPAFWASAFSLRSSAPRSISTQARVVFSSAVDCVVIPRVKKLDSAEDRCKTNPDGRSKM